MNPEYKGELNFWLKTSRWSFKNYNQNINKNSFEASHAMGPGSIHGKVLCSLEIYITDIPNCHITIMMIKFYIIPR